VVSGDGGVGEVEANFRVIIFDFGTDADDVCGGHKEDMSGVMG
jgi:hypothetical protein